MTTSFIIPAFNASATIGRCLDSIYELQLQPREFEVIVIDDCSTDNTVEIIEKYAFSCDNLLLIRQPENHRQGAARNLGIACAKGDYVVFVDSDDEADRGLTRALQLAANNNLDMVAMQYAKVGKEGKSDEEVVLPYKQDKVFNGIELQTEFAFWCTAPWAYVYRKAFLNEVNYPFAENVLYEDSDFVNVHLYHAKRMAYCNECGYKAHYNPESTTHTMSYKHLCDYALLGTRMLDFYRSIEDKTTRCADSILEGGGYNLMIAFKKLFKLQSLQDVRAFYDRLDSMCDRKTLLGYRHPSYCWTKWTRFCIRHRKLATMVVGVMSPIISLKNE